MSTHEAAIEAAKQQLPSAEQMLTGWPRLPAVPGAVYTELDMFETSGFKDPRLVLYTGISRLPSVTVGWCMFGAARNVQPGHVALPPPAREALADSNAVRALQLLAVDSAETEEAAIETLAIPGVTGSLVGLAAAAHQEHEGQSLPLRCEVGTHVYACHRGPVRLGANTADVVLIGSPIWIAKTQT